MRLRSSGIYGVAASPQNVCLLMDECSANICPLQRKLKLDLPSVIKPQKQPVGGTPFAIHAIFDDCVPACAFACVVMEEREREMRTKEVTVEKVGESKRKINYISSEYKKQRRFHICT